MFRKKYHSCEIIKGLISGEPAIYRYLDATFRPKVIKYVCSNSGVLQDGEELYQDVVFEVYINVERNKYDVSKSKFCTYFMMIARNRWIDKLRKKQRTINTVSLAESNYQIERKNAGDTESLDNYNNKVRAIRRCIAQLNKDEQEMIRLFYFAKMSLETVAAKMNISYGYAKQKIHRIRAKLKNLLSEDLTCGLDLNLESEISPFIEEFNKYPN
jgi:RNA polymerase sigma-70 factor (ECF subfamily)